MKILVIGSKGFIGSHCVEHFKSKHQVFECDVVTDYVSSSYYQVDATNSDYSEVFQSQNFDFCLNCSGAASVPESIINPQKDFYLNVVNTYKQLEAIRKYNPDCKYVMLSSAAVYGNPKYLPIDEDHPLNPISPYGVHKKMAEEICSMYKSDYKLSTYCLRIFSAYGEGLQKQLFWDLGLKAKKSIILNLYGTGDESRDFVHISDIVKAIEIIIHTPPEYSILNIASATETKIKGAASTFVKYFNPSLEIQFKGEKREGDPSNWVADITRMEQLGFRVKTTLDEGLRDYIKWLIENA